MDPSEPSFLFSKLVCCVLLLPALFRFYVSFMVDLKNMMKIAAFFLFIYFSYQINKWEGYYMLWNVVMLIDLSVCSPGCFSWFVQAVANVNTIIAPALIGKVCSYLFYSSVFFNLLIMPITVFFFHLPIILLIPWLVLILWFTCLSATNRTQLSRQKLTTSWFRSLMEPLMNGVGANKRCLTDYACKL